MGGARSNQRCVILTPEMAEHGRRMVLQMRATVSRYLGGEIQKLRCLFEAFLCKPLAIPQMRCDCLEWIRAIHLPARSVRLSLKMTTGKIQQVAATLDGAIAKDRVKPHEGINIVILQSDQAGVSIRCHLPPCGIGPCGGIDGRCSCRHGTLLPCLVSHGHSPLHVTPRRTRRANSDCCALAASENQCLRRGCGTTSRTRRKNE